MSKLFVSVCILLSAVMQAGPDKPDSKSSRQLYEQAAKAIASADSRAAIMPLEQLIEDQSTSSLACIAAVHLAECYVANDRQTDALALLEKWSDRIAIASTTTKLDANLDAHHLRVWLQAAKRTSDDATSIPSLEVLTQAIESRSESSEKTSAVLSQLRELIVDARMELAKRLTAAGKLELAAEQLRRLNESTTEIPSEAQLFFAMLHQQLGDHSQAQSILQSLIERVPNTPSHLLARLELATYALQARKIDVAATWLSPMIDSKLPHHGLDEVSDCRFRIIWSELALAQGNPARSLEVLPNDAELSQLDEPQQVAVRFGRAEAASQAGKHAMALGDLQWLSDYASKAASEPKWAVTVALRESELLLKTKDYAKLEGAVSDAKQRFTGFERLHEFDYLLARAAMQQIDFVQARVHLKAIEESTEKNTSAAARAQWMLGESYFMEQNLSEAIIAYKPVTLLPASQPWQTLALMQTAKCFELLNQSSDALEAYQRVLSTTQDEKIRQEAAARIEVIERIANKTKPSALR